jgi:hypothetical protein
MLPYLSYNVVRLLHEDRIRDSLRPVPEWIGIDAPRARQRSADGARRRLRSSFARALRRLAFSLDPQVSTDRALQTG